MNVQYPDSTPDIYTLLLNNDFYPHTCEIITTIETHISTVFLTGNYAYKVKKAVDFGFLNFTDIQQRKKFCEMEVTLNQRTAPEIYLEVMAIDCQADGHCSLVAADKAVNPIEYLVKMKQFDPNDVLSKYLKRNEAEQSLIQSLVDNIVKLHQSAETFADDSPWGTPKIVLQPMLDNFSTLAKFCEFSDDTLQKISELSVWTDHKAEELAPVVLKRKAAGFVRACHGDLHMDNIAVIDEKAVLFDGIEFNDHFRCIDVISDLSFLIVDLIYRGNQPLAFEILSLYLHQTQDYQATKLLPYYLIYRAMVRAKIAVLRAQQCDVASKEHTEKVAEAEAYITLAHSLTQPQSPKLILMQGVSGSGKSYAANQLQELLPAIIISSDRTRKKLFNISALTRVDSESKADLYSPAMNHKTYQALQTNAQLALNNQWSVIVDATFLKKEHREHFYQIAQTLEIDSYLISFQPEKEWIEQAIRARMLKNNNPSDATIEVMLMQQNNIEFPHNDETHLVIRPDISSQAWPVQAIKDFLKLVDK